MTARPQLWLRPVPATVVFQQPNPVLSGPNCMLEMEVVPAAEVTQVPGYVVPAEIDQDAHAWPNVNLTNLRFTVSRNYPASNASETIGKVYKLSATGILSAVYDIRYMIGKLTVVAS